MTGFYFICECKDRKYIKKSIATLKVSAILCLAKIGTLAIHVADFVST